MRARNIKPGFFKNADLAELPFEARILFQGLWCLADRKGRLIDRPKQIKGEVFPYDNVSIDTMLAQLQHSAFIVRYIKDQKKYIQIVNFEKHQYPHIRESESTIPAPYKHSANTIPARLNPDVLNPESPILNPESKTPSAKAVPGFWKELIQHMNDTWSKRKRGSKYLWSGKDFAALKRVLVIYRVFDVMALWDIYIGSSDEFAIKQGFNIPEFVRQLPRLVDGSWKTLADRYMQKLMPSNPENMARVQDLIAQASFGKEISK